jgi:microcystin-dependent protein
MGNHGHRLQIVGFYGDAGGAATTLAKEALGPTGGRAAHDNMMPFLPLQFVIALSGVFPNRSEE